MKYKKICLVGYGSHVKNTIIPSLNLDKKNIKIITKKTLNDFETFSSVKEALKALPKDYIFLIPHLQNFIIQYQSLLYYQVLIL